MKKFFLKFLSTLAVVFLFCFIPVFFIYVSAHYLPDGDSWDDTIQMYFRYLDHSLGVKEWFLPHNEHRLLLTRAIYFAKDLLWPSSRYFIISISYFLLFSTYILLLLNLKNSKSIFQLKEKNNFFIFFILGCLLFSPLDASYWSWPYLIQFPLTVFFITSTFFLILRKKINWLVFFFSVILSFLATFSSANGLSVWVIAFLLLFFNKVDKLKLAVYGIIGVFTIILYSKNNHFIGFSISQPLHSLAYFFIFLGAWSIQYYCLAMIFGLFSLFLYLYAVYFTFKRIDYEKRVHFYPWLALGLFVIMNAFTASLVRVQIGVCEGLSSRYPAITSLMAVSLLGFYALSSKKIPNVPQILFRILSFVIMLSFLINVVIVLGNFTQHYFLSKQVIALPYNVILPLDNDTYPSGNAAIGERLSRYKKSSLYMLDEPKPNYLNRVLSSKDQKMIGIVASPKNYLIRFSNVDVSRRYGELTSGAGVDGVSYVNNICDPRMSNSLLFLNKDQEVIGVAFIVKGIFTCSGFSTANLYGFVLAQQKINTILWLYKSYGVVQKLERRAKIGLYG